MKVPTGGQFRELDRQTIEHEPVASLQLMERAATAMTRCVMQRWSARHRILVFAGAGNNGGDALAMARLLAQSQYHVAVWLFNVKGQLSPDCQANLERLDGSGVTLHEVRQELQFPDIDREDVVIDGLFGTGLNKAISGGFAAVVQRINSAKAHVVSIDIPSGLMLEDNSYNDMSHVIQAELTLTMQLPKLAFLLPDNAAYVGEWQAVDIGLLPQAIEQLHTPYHIIEEAEVAAMLKRRPRFAHKGTMGHALLVAGSSGMAGAALLACRACLRSGVGKLTLQTPTDNRIIIQTALPEAILAQDPHPQIVTQCMGVAPYEAMGIGPGLGQDERTAQALHQYMSIVDSPMVLDADALNILGFHCDWQATIPADSILTPHVGELERLLGCCASSYERLSRAQEFATQHHLYLVLKGHYTAICTPRGSVLFCPKGNPGMATAGSGDVLTGLITGLLAQGYAPDEAAILGVWLHASAGDTAAAQLGEECMLASDIVNCLPQAFKQLRETKRT